MSSKLFTNCLKLAVYEVNELRYNC